MGTGDSLSSQSSDSLTLSAADFESARMLGVKFAATFPEPPLQISSVGDLLGEELNEPLNRIAVSAGRRLFGRGVEADLDVAFSEVELDGLRGCLSALATVAANSAEATFLYREWLEECGLPFDALEDPSDDELRALVDEVGEFSDLNPEMVFELESHVETTEESVAASPSGESGISALTDDDGRMAWIYGHLFAADSGRGDADRHGSSMPPGDGLHTHLMVGLIVDHCADRFGVISVDQTTLTVEQHEYLKRYVGAMWTVFQVAAGLTEQHAASVSEQDLVALQDAGAPSTLEAVWRFWTENPGLEIEFGPGAEIEDFARFTVRLGDSGTDDHDHPVEPNPDPPDSLDQRAVMRGEQFGDSYAAIWEPLGAIAPLVDAYARGEARRLVESTPTPRRRWSIAGYATLSVGLLFLALSVMTLSPWWLLGALGAAVAAGMRASIGAKKMEEQRSSCASRLTAVINDAAIARLRERQGEQATEKFWRARVALAWEETQDAAMLEAEQRRDSRQQAREDAVRAAEDQLLRRYEARRRKTVSTKPIAVVPPPAPQPFGVSHVGAERLVAQWIRHLGEPDAEVTRVSGDGGIDVAGARFIAQVKNYSGAVPVASIRELAGVAHDDGRAPLFFTSGVYTDGAVQFADRVGMALFTYSAEEGTLSAGNILGAHAIDRGLG